jgi:uncharacterized protein YegJ (DUF2314 family)
MAQGTDLPIRLRLPEEVEIAFVVHLRLGGSDGDDKHRLAAALRGWVMDHARPPMCEAILKRLAFGKLYFRRLPKQPALTALSDEEGKRRLAASDSAVHLAVVDSLALPRPGLWLALSMARALACEGDGVIFDEQATAYRPASSCRSPVSENGEISAAEHIMLFSSVDDRGRGWVTTCGMRKFGLPDLEVQDAPPDLASGIGDVLNGTAQLLLDEIWRAARAAPEGPREIAISPELELTPEVVARSLQSCSYQPPPEARPARLRLELVISRNVGIPFLSVGPPRAYAEGPGTWLHEVHRNLCPVDEGIVFPDPDDPALLRAHQEALRGLPRVKRRFRKGLRPGEALLVKHGFQAEEIEKEFMWVAVKTWKGARIQGQLSSEPTSCPGLRMGQAVELLESEIFDWVMVCPDGTEEGGFTTRVLLGGRPPPESPGPA